MADQGRTAGRGRDGRWRAAGAALAALLLAASCTAPAATSPDTTVRDVRATLDRRAAAVLDHDPDAYAATVAPGATGLRTAQRRELANLADVPLSSWTYSVTDVHEHGTDKATADVELRYRIAGYDSAPVTVDRVLDMERHGADGRWYIAADRAGKGSGRQLWQQGVVRVVRGAHSLVLGVGRTQEELRRIADTEDRAVPAVSAAWPEHWAARVVVIVPKTVDDMAGLLGAPVANYRGIAAVTTGETGGSGRTPADRVIVNPQAYAMLGTFGQRVVLTHETAHVATRARTSAATPTWLSEGFADWAAYRAEDRTPAQAAPELAEAVRRGELPAALPTDEDFRFGGDSGRLARAYEGGWLACALIADHWGEEKLFAFYRAVAGHSGRDGAVEQALHEVLGTTEQDFTARWREYLRSRLG
ncbi:hypothetical protein OG930_12365 [Streptomyces sp. NBC_01799]|uniref:hypothetical protein n=1 Tax=Streptomyces sp. NBC_01800 TaxID=2975945 RepID=UPI002DD7EF28|nr:hypothetical protein [Streptomyces sp. NBC_01800]WSA67738.1 hypothetical protein OIE65_12500 [Streptomyces sp. NBC_01800]WSA76332.1 hypothetical protein OG930_12365 [Streptomyces sp. NBC_01799]